MGIYRRLCRVDETQGVRYPPWEEEVEEDDLRDQFFRLRREYGRCVSKVYIDGPDNAAIPVGWVFQRRETYSDCPHTFLCETWVSFYRRIEDDRLSLAELKALHSTNG